MARKIILFSFFFFLLLPLLRVYYGIMGRWVDLVLLVEVRIDKYFHCYNIILLTIEN